MEKSEMSSGHHYRKQKKLLEKLRGDLRRLAPPEPPDGLLQRILTAIPAPGTRYHASSGISWKGALAGAAILLAASGVTFYLIGETGRTSGAERVLRLTDTRYMVVDESVSNFQETRPCDTLPVLPNWLS
ncbi:MAG: hypothetical protein ACYTAN_04960 [Planctomycetota bacterium]|jgi:hypothetical protein